VHDKNNEMEGMAMHNTIDTIFDEDLRIAYDDGHEDGRIEIASFVNKTQDSSVDREILNHRYKFDLVHKRWEVLYDYDGAPKLKEARKRQLYWEHGYVALRG
jgi:hypothetical protein